MSAARTPDDLITEDSLLSLADYLDLLSEVSTEPRFRILFYLTQVEEDNASSIADELEMDPGTLSYHLERLTEDGLTRNWQRTSRDDDGNYSYYTITGLGERITSRVADLVEADQDEISYEGTISEPEDAPSSSLTADEERTAADEVRADAADEARADLGDGVRADADGSAESTTAESDDRRRPTARAPVKSATDSSASKPSDSSSRKPESAAGTTADADSAYSRDSGEHEDDASDESLLNSAARVVSDRLPSRFGGQDERTSPSSPTVAVELPMGADSTEREEIAEVFERFDELDVDATLEPTEGHAASDYRGDRSRGPRHSFSRTEQGLKSRQAVEYAMREEFQTRHHGRLVTDFSPATGGQGSE